MLSSLYMTCLNSDMELFLMMVMISGKRFNAIQNRGFDDDESTSSKHFMRFVGENCWGMKATTKRTLDAISSALSSLFSSFEVKREDFMMVLLNVMISSATCTHDDGGINITIFLSIRDILKIESSSMPSFC